MAVASLLIALACGRDYPAEQILGLAQTIAEDSSADPHGDETDSGVRGAVAPERAELNVLNDAAEIQHLIAGALSRYNGRTLNLDDLFARAEALRKDLEYAHDVAERLQRGMLQRPDDAEPDQFGPPTPAQATVWSELHDNQRARAAATRRDQAAARLEAMGPPISWRITEYLPNGCYLACRDDAEARRTCEATHGPMHGWATVPETVPDMLRQWSIPSTRPVTVEWEAEPHRPPGRLPPPPVGIFPTIPTFRST